LTKDECLKPLPQMCPNYKPISTTLASGTASKRRTMLSGVPHMHKYPIFGL